MHIVQTQLSTSRYITLSKLYLSIYVYKICIYPSISKNLTIRTQGISISSNELISLIILRLLSSIVKFFDSIVQGFFCSFQSYCVFMLIVLYVLQLYCFSSPISGHLLSTSILFHRTISHPTRNRLILPNNRLLFSRMAV